MEASDIRPRQSLLNAVSAVVTIKLLKWTNRVTKQKAIFSIIALKDCMKGVNKMKILVRLHRSPVQLFLVNLVDKKIAEEIRTLIDKSNHSQAMAVALTKGSFERELDHCELQGLNADLILTENDARWDVKQNGC